MVGVSKDGGKLDRRRYGWSTGPAHSHFQATGPASLVISSDCGMGREGMSRRHAQYKMVALVQGTNIVRRELGLPEAPCLAADERFSLVVPVS
jgi:hypothetical protein